MAFNLAFISGSDMLCLILAGLSVIFQGAWVFGKCTQTSISMCTSERMSGPMVLVDFERVPRHETNLSCFCYVFTYQNGRISVQYSTVGGYTLPVLSVLVENVPLKSFSVAWSPISVDGHKTFRYRGNTDNSVPALCLKIIAENNQTTLSVRCTENGNTSIPTETATTQKSTDHTTVTSGSTRSHSVTTGRTDKTTVHSTTLSTATGSDTTGSTERITATEEPGSVDIAVIAGAAGGGCVVLVVVVIITVFFCKRSSKQQKQPETNVQYNPNQEDDTYNVENAMYVSADLDSATYDKPDIEVTYDTADDVMYEKSSSGHLYDSTNTKPQRTAVQNEYSSVLTNKRNNPHSPDNDDTYNRINHGANPRTASPDDTYDTARH